MRITDFWRRMDEHFGATYARSVAQDQVMSELGGRTVVESLAAGEDVKDIWRAVCVHFEVPAQHR